MPNPPHHIYLISPILQNREISSTNNSQTRSFKPKKPNLQNPFPKPKLQKNKN